MVSTVVTYEKPAPRAKKSIKIPDACKALGVDWRAPEVSGVLGDPDRFSQQPPKNRAHLQHE